MAAAAVEQIGAAQPAGREQLVDKVLHRQFEEERAAAQAPDRPARRHGIDEALYAGIIGGIEQEGGLLPEGGLAVEQRGPIVAYAAFGEVFAQAAAEGGGHLQVIVERYVVLGGGGGHARQRLFEQSERRLQRGLVARQRGQLVKQALFERGVIGGSQARLLRRQGQRHGALFDAQRHGQRALAAVHMVEYGHERLTGGQRFVRQIGAA